MTSAALRILAVEDDPMQVFSLTVLLRGLGYALVGAVPTAEEALRCFAETQPDVVLLDINLAGPCDGIELAHALVAQRPVPLIFLTAYPDQDTFERARQVGPFAFLGKPYNGPLLGHTIELAMQHFATAQGVLPDGSGGVADGAVLLGGVFVRAAGRLHKVPFAGLLVAEADNSYTHLHTVGHKFTLRSSLQALEAALPAGAFVRIHRRYLVQAAAVTAFDPHTVSVGDRRLPLGRAFREAVRAQLLLLR